MYHKITEGVPRSPRVIGYEVYMNTWLGEKRHAMHQNEHEQWNLTHYPGTRQLCSRCEEPTGRCEEDTIWSEDVEPLCESCGVLSSL